MRFYSIDELMNAEIYDSLGLFYGRVCGIEYRPDSPRIKACIVLEAEDTVPDIDFIKRKLTEKGVSYEEESLEFLVVLAREHNIDIPYKTVQRSINLVKGFISPSEVALIDDYIQRTQRKTIILLNNPREARYRGRTIQSSKPSPLPELVNGKLVVSLKNGVLGKAVSIVIGPGEPGLRVRRIGRVSGYIAWLRFLNDVKKKSMELYNKLAEIRDPLIKRRISLEEYDELIEEMRSKGLSSDIISMIDNYIESEEGSGNLYVDIPWSKVRVVNDIVVVE